MKKYHLLLARDAGKWSVQFGSFDRSDVVSEKAEYRSEYAARDLWVTSIPCKANGHAPSQKTVDLMLSVLNSK